MDACAPKAAADDAARTESDSEDARALGAGRVRREHEVAEAPRHEAPACPLDRLEHVRVGAEDDMGPRVESELLHVPQVIAPMETPDTQVTSESEPAGDSGWGF